MTALERFNTLNSADAHSVMMTACGSGKWALLMTRGRPYQTTMSLMRAADASADALGNEDWLEAFSHHPRIGERNLHQPKFAETAVQSSREQSGMAGASEEVRRAFEAGNREYESKFGHVFLICATGKSGEEMLESLRRRMMNEPEREFAQAVSEQRAITRIRLERMFSS